MVANLRRRLRDSSRSMSQRATAEVLWPLGCVYARHVLQGSFEFQPARGKKVPAPENVGEGEGLRPRSDAEQAEY